METKSLNNTAQTSPGREIMLQNSTINWRRFIACFFAVGVVAKGIVPGILFGLLFADVMDSNSSLFRPEGSELPMLEVLGMIPWTFMFVLLYVKGTWEKGLIGGLKYGLCVWLLYFVPMLLAFWAWIAFTNEWVIAGLVSGLAQAIVAGLLVAWIYRVPAVKPAVQFN